MNIPTSSASNTEVFDWIFVYANKVTAADLLRAKHTHKDILVHFLTLLRMSIRDTGKFHNPKTRLTKNMMESSIRAEVHNYADEFLFHPRVLPEYHPIHRAEMIKIILELLNKQGIDARVAVSGPTESGLVVEPKKSN